jgi:hypothetical protein
MVDHADHRDKVDNDHTTNSETKEPREQPRIITAIPIPGTHREGRSHLISSSPIYIKCLGIYVEPPIDFLSEQEAIHFIDEWRIDGTSSSSGSGNGCGTKPSYEETPSAPGGNNTDKQPVEILLAELKDEFEARRQNVLKKTTAEILQEKANQRNRFKRIIAEDVTKSGELHLESGSTRPLCGSNDKYHEAVSKIKTNIVPPRLTNSKSKPSKIEPNTLNLRYSMEKLYKSREAQRQEEKRMLEKAEENRRRAAEAACDGDYTECFMTETSSLGNLSVFFDLCVEDTPHHLSNTNQPPFFQRLPTNLKERCLKAVDDFVVRKEQITSSQGYKTETTVTFNKIVPCRY